MSEDTIDSDEDEVKPVRLELATRRVSRLNVVDRARISIHDTSWELDFGDGDLARVDTPTLQHPDALKAEVLRQTRLLLEFKSEGQVRHQARELVNDFPVTVMEPGLASVTPFESTDRHGRKYHSAFVYVVCGIRVPLYPKVIWGVMVEQSSRRVWTTSDKLLRPAKFGHAALIQDRQAIRVNAPRSMWHQAWSWAVADADDDTPGIDLVREDWRQECEGLAPHSEWVKVGSHEWKRS